MVGYSINKRWRRKAYVYKCKLEMENRTNSRETNKECKRIIIEDCTE